MLQGQLSDLVTPGCLRSSTGSPLNVTCLREAFRGIRYRCYCYGKALIKGPPSLKGKHVGYRACPVLVYCSTITRKSALFLPNHKSSNWSSSPLHYTGIDFPETWGTQSGSHPSPRPCHWGASELQQWQQPPMGSGHRSPGGGHCNTLWSARTLKLPLLSRSNFPPKWWSIDSPFLHPSVQTYI